MRFVHILFCSLIAGLSACSSAPQAALQTAFYVFRVEPPALIELSADYQPLREIPFAMPAGCGFHDLFPAPRGAYIAIELSCPFGQAVVWLDSETGMFQQAFTEADSHFLAWTPDGEAVYLKVDSINAPRIVRAAIDGRQDSLPISEFTYDLAPNPNGGRFIFSLSRGMGLGSQMYSAQSNGLAVKQVMTDENNYLSLARWSPDGKQIAFIKIPDSQTPFTIGELWLMNADGSNARFLAKADAGHGFAPAWSPDGTRLAYVVRENPNESQADQSAEALVSNIYIVNVESGESTPLTKFQNARVEAPVWSPDGNTIAFTAVLDGRIEVQVAHAASGESQAVLTESACCPAWIRK